MMTSIDEIDRYIHKTRCKGPEALQLKQAWIGWVGQLTWYERNVDKRKLREARNRVTAFDTANGGSRIGAEALRTTIRLGSTGSDVEFWQKHLKLPVTGTFDEGTKSATKAYQSEKGLVADGIVGPMTWGTVSTSKIAVPSLLKGHGKTIGMWAGLGIVFSAVLGAFSSDSKKDSHGK